ncbi:DMT family transporter [Pigmentiphaga aceris]|nr:DMT family transporter [Pigmentiphaga aceris]
MTERNRHPHGEPLQAERKQDEQDAASASSNAPSNASPGGPRNAAPNVAPNVPPNIPPKAPFTTSRTQRARQHWHVAKTRASGLSAPWLMVIATLMFATMGVCVKLASADYSTGEIMFYRSVIGIVMMVFLARSQGISLATRVPVNHFWRSVTGVVSMYMWFYSVGGLPVATAMTLNYMSSVWMAVFMIGGALLFGTSKVDKRMVVSVLLGFVGVALVLQPTMAENQWWYGLIGLLSGMISATAYLQVGALARAGEPVTRIVFYFSIAGMVLGFITALPAGLHPLTFKGVFLHLTVGVLAGFAQILLTRAYAIGRTLVNASLQYLGIAFAAIYGVVWFSDPMSTSLFIGMVMIVGAGMCAAMLKSKPVSTKSR